MVDFFKDCIKKRLLSKAFSVADFETHYYTKIIDMKTIERRRKQCWIHKEPEIVQGQEIVTPGTTETAPRRQHLEEDEDDIENENSQQNDNMQDENLQQTYDMDKI